MYCGPDFLNDYKQVAEEISVSGPMNALFAKMFYKMKVEGRNNWKSYIPALKRNTIMPYKLTLAHYFSYYNNSESLIKILHGEFKYLRDSFKKTPL